MGCDFEATGYGATEFGNGVLQLSTIVSSSSFPGLPQTIRKNQCLEASVMKTSCCQRHESAIAVHIPCWYCNVVGTTATMNCSYDVENCNESQTAVMKVTRTLRFTSVFTVTSCATIKLVGAAYNAE
jgi:hypothetical protein